MRRNLFVLLSIAVLALVLSVSCDGSVSGKIGDTQMTPFYAKAREAFRVSSGVTLPEIGDLDLDKFLEAEAYDLEMEQFNEVIKNGGGEMSFDLNKGITLEAYLGIVNAIGVVFGPEYYVDHIGGYDIEVWKKDNTYVTVKFKVNTKISVIIN